MDDPSLNKSGWSKKEEERLRALAVEFSEHNWVMISSLLGTDRPPIGT